MPIALSNDERIKIKNRLIEAAEISLMEFGAKKTTVDNLVRKVNIPNEA